MFLKKYKLYNLIEKEIYILTKSTIKKYINTLSLQLPSTSFHILKSLHDSLIINTTNYISFNVHNQAIIHLLNVEQIIEQNLISLV